MKPRPVAYALGLFSLVMLTLTVLRATSSIPLGRVASCGSATFPNPEYYRATYGRAGECHSQVNSARLAAIVFGLIFAVAALGSLRAHRRALQQQWGESHGRAA